MTNSQMTVPGIQFLIEELVYYPTRNHVPVHLRPYVFNTNHDAISTISDRMQQTASGTISAGVLNGLISGIVQPSSVGIASTVNSSWVGNRRFIFMMRVRHVDYMGVEVCTYLFGYTEHDGITPNGAIDMSMTHFINNVIETAATTYQTPLGVRRDEKLTGVYNAIFSTSTTDLYAQRPVDIYQTFSMNEMANFSDMDAKFYNASSTITPFSNNIVTSTAENGITAEYLSKILTSGMHAMKSREVHVNAYEMGSNDPTEKFFTEPSINECAFVRTLSRAAGFRSVTGTFPFTALMSMDSTIYDRFQLFNFTQDFSNPLLASTPEVGENWDGQDMITTKAYSLIENAVGMATKYGFTKMSFMMTNMSDALGTISSAILNFNSFLKLSPADNGYLLEIFKERFRNEVFLNESNVGRVSLAIEVHVDLLGTSKIYLEYAGYQGVWFTIPTFANSLFAPVVCNDQAMVEVAASHIGQTLTALIGNEPVRYY